jgi:hypothetical protein
MDASGQNQELKPGKPFPLFAANYSLVVSSIKVVVACVSFVLLGFVPKSISGAASVLLLLFLFFAFLSSFLMGIVSLFGIPYYGVRPILWRSLIGILVSLFFGFFSGLVLLASQIGIGC